MAKKRKLLPGVRVHQDAVTGQLVSTVQDAVELAFQAVFKAAERERLKLNMADQYRLANRLIDYAEGCLPHTVGEGA